MPVLNREQILDMPLETEVVDVPEWGDGAQVIVSEMNGLGREVYEDLIFDGKGKVVSDKSLRACLVACTAVDEKGELIFTKKDADALGRQSAKALQRIYAAAERLNGLGRYATKAAAKNS